MFTLTTPSGQTTGDICDVLAAAEAGGLVGLPAAPHYARHGVVANLGALMAVLWAYSERPRPWGADEWRSEWDAQLGPGNREFIRPMDEPALFQRPVSPGAKIEPIEPAEIGPSPLGDLHIRKAKKVPDEAVVLGHIASTLRPTTGVGRGGAGTRAGFLMVIPTDGTIGSEINAVAEATTVSGGTSAKDHVVWLSPSLQTAVPTSASPLIDAPMASRLTPDGVLLDPRIARLLHPVCLAPEHIAQVIAPRHQIGQPNPCRVARRRRPEFQRPAHLGQHLRIHPVGLGQPSGGAGKLARLARIDPSEGGARFAQRLHERALITTGGFQHHQRAARLCRKALQRPSLAGNPTAPSVRKDVNVDPVLGDVDADDVLCHDKRACP